MKHRTRTRFFRGRARRKQPPPKGGRQTVSERNLWSPPGGSVFWTEVHRVEPAGASATILLRNRYICNRHIPLQSGVEALGRQNHQGQHGIEALQKRTVILHVSCVVYHAAELRLYCAATDLC